MILHFPNYHSAGYLLQIHYDFSTPAYGPLDARWIGNWWLMFPTVGFVAISVSTVIACYPTRAQMRRYAAARAAKNEKEPLKVAEDEPIRSGEVGSTNKFGGFCAALKNVFRFARWRWVGRSRSIRHHCTCKINMVKQLNDQ